MKKLRWKAIGVAGVLSSFASMLLALGIVRLLTMTGVLSAGIGFERAFAAMLLIVVLTVVFSSIFSFVTLYALAWEARAVNAWLAVVVSFAVDIIIGFPILLLSAIASR